MNSEIQSQIRLGRPEDLYYYAESSLRKQSIPCFQNTEFTQNISPTAGRGNYQVIFSRNQGLSHVIIGAKLKAHTGAAGLNYAGIGVSRGWLANLIDRVSYRIAGSSQYWQTGQQLMVANALESTNPTVKQDLFNLCGQALSTTTEFQTDELLYAYMYFNMPVNKPFCGTESPLPLPTELLNSNVILSIDLAPVTSIYSSSNALGAVSAAPDALQELYVQFQQIMAVDSGELMRMGGDRSKMYSLPCKGFYTQELQIGIPANSTAAGQTQDIALTGFQSGQVKSIIAWLTDNADTAPTTSAPFARNANCFAYGQNYLLKYNGQNIHFFPGTSSTMWGELLCDVPPYLDSVRYDISGVLVPSDERSHFVVFPLGQSVEQVNPKILINGRSIGTSIMNLSLKVPDATKAYTLHVMYFYNTVLSISGAGEAAFVF